ncbi:methyltransferase MtaB domain-containing protein [Caldicellulosiruptoraceae bacterium PP1]
MTFNTLAYADVNEFIFGKCKKPLTLKNGIKIGDGKVIPEVNFTLPPIEISKENITEIIEEYKKITYSILKRAIELNQEELVIEIELLPPMTLNPTWGAEICKTVKDTISEYESKYNIRCGLRITPNDLREMQRPVKLRNGNLLENILKTFELCAQNGADMLAIESTGGKELHDYSLMNGDIKGVLLSLGVLAPRDISFLWEKIISIANNTDTIPSGDTACAFANTAMVLAEQKFIPKIFAAIDRVASVPRTLIPYTIGAVGPGKDCGYENPYIKAIAGFPISMEGKSSACAHFSSVGNIAMSVADLWSNESVQNIRLLSGYAPIVSTEQLIYDCRLVNKALSNQETSLIVRDLLADSDAFLDVQAFVLHPKTVINIAKEIIKYSSAFLMTKYAIFATVEEIDKAIHDRLISLDEKETKWLDFIKSEIEEIPDDEEKFINDIKNFYDNDLLLFNEYNISV